MAGSQRQVATGVLSLLVTCALVVWITDATIRAAPLDQLTLGLLIGRDPFQRLPLADALATAVGRSAVLVGVALAAAIVVGGLTALAYAFSGRTWVRAVAWTAGTIGASVPSFFWALLFELVVVLVYLRTQTLIAPVTGGFGLDGRLVLPAAALAMRPAAYVFRTMAPALDEARHAPHVVTALAKGLGPMAIALRHVMRNAAPAVLAGLALGAKTSVSSLAIVEYVFNWNGAGYGFIVAVAKGQIALASATLLLFFPRPAALNGGMALTTRALAVTARCSGRTRAASSRTHR